MPIGKVKWYNAERGFGFVSNPDGEDCYVSQKVLPPGVEELYPGQRIEFDFVSGRKGPQALRVQLVDKPKQRKVQHKFPPEELASMIADLATTLESSVQPVLAQGRYPDRKEATQIAKILRVVADELDV
ncbi:cold shock protein [Corynebacterium kutscheri]|uniref:Cold shock protein n=1 Tax=Corynebacterium kutscheri TaxID=35755 RepID=A0A0F6R1J3_9CORY|nr:cold-shock protein [Corynebacterium kutscheri]AKE41890.1 cold shock protein [Corynebacterium kutscheri]VEH04430.1 cold shock protein [Corynebacterium kutscheri]VEH10218.1 cold shock protein [Corynebacterium kutscheri]VEH80300.1 cold shock protein [Corynebacterium kutscheri]